MTGLGASYGGAQQLRQADQIVGGHREGELPIDFEQPAMARLAQSGDGFSLAERFLDTLADAQADGVAGMAGGAAVNRRAPRADVLRHMRRGVDFAQFGHEVLRVEALVAAHGDLVRPVGMRFEQMQYRQTLGMTRCAGGHRADDQPVAVFHQCVPHEGEFGLLATAFAIQLGIWVRG